MSIMPEDSLKQKEHHKLTKSEFLILLFIIPVTFCKSIGLSSNNKVYYAIFIYGVFLVIVKLFKDKFSKKQFIGFVSIIIIGMLNFIFGKQTVVLFTAIILCCMKDIKIDKIIKYMFWIRLLTFIGIALLTSFGVLENNYLLFYRNGEYIKRYSFIFGHPNLAHSSFTIIAILGIYIFYNKLNIINVSVIEVINYIMYRFTYSRTGFLICSIFVIFALIYKKNKTLKKYCYKIIKYFLIIMILITIICGILYPKIDALKKLDIILTGRIGYISLLIKNYTIPIIGSDKYNSVAMFDNGYMSLLYEGGLLATCWYIYYYLKTVKVLIKNNMEREILLTMIFMTYSLTESYYVNVIMNPSLLFFSYYMFQEFKEKGE